MSLFLSILITLFLISVVLAFIYMLVGFIMEKKSPKEEIEEPEVKEEKVEEPTPNKEESNHEYNKDYRNERKRILSELNIKQKSKIADINFDESLSEEQKEMKRQEIKKSIAQEKEKKLVALENKYKNNQ